MTMNPMDLTGSTILVTGASSGLGREICVLLSRLGANVVLVARDSERLTQTLEMLECGNHRIESYDLCDVEGIPRWLKGVAEHTGPLHGIVHSAGVHAMGPVRFLKPASLHELMQINLTAAVQLTKGVRQKGVCGTPASVVFLSSVMGLVGQAGVSAYCASKGALIALARALAVELAPEQIRVNCVAPGHVRAGMGAPQQSHLTAEQVAAIEARHPLGFGEAEDVAHATAFLLARTGRWITGTTLVVDGGYSAW